MTYQVERPESVANATNEGSINALQLLQEHSTLPKTATDLEKLNFRASDEVLNCHAEPDPFRLEKTFHPNGQPKTSVQYINGEKAYVRDFDEQGRQIKKSSVSGDKVWWAATYDPVTGLTTSDTLYNKDTGKPVMKTTFREDGSMATYSTYWDNGKTATELTRWKDGSTTSTKYDKDGDVKFRVTVKPNGDKIWHDKPFFTPSDKDIIGDDDRRRLEAKAPKAN